MSTALFFLASIVLLFVWKRQIISRSLSRRAPSLRALPGIALLCLILGALSTGIGWSTVGLPYLAGFNPMTVHVALGDLGRQEQRQVVLGGGVVVVVDLRLPMLSQGLWVCHLRTHPVSRRRTARSASW